MLAVAQNLCERYAAASATAARLHALMRRTGLSQGLVTLLGLRAISRLALLDLDEAVQHADAAEEVARLQRVPHLLHFALWVRAVVHDARGETAEVERAVREAQRLLGAIESSKLSRTGDCEFAYLGSPSDPQRAIEDMEAAAGADLVHADPTWRSWLLLRMVRAGIAAGRLDDAERWARIATEHTARLRLPVGMTRAACARAELLLARGDAARAAALAAEAIAAAERAGAPLDALEARLLAAARTPPPATPRRPRTRSSVSRPTRHAAARCACATTPRATCDGSARASRPTAGAPHAAAATRELTERERDIAELVAAGSSNKQVAATLFLSEKTVENALTRVYAKLGGGGIGADDIDSGAGDDELDAQEGPDVVHGGAGNDTLQADDWTEQSTDVIDGGPGYDQISNNWVSEVGKYQPPIVVSVDGVANDGRPGENDNVTDVEKIYLNAPASLTGSDGPDELTMFNTDAGGTLNGRGGDDKLSGFDLDDTIDGGAGNDQIQGGYGHDTISGGPGRDVINGDASGSTCHWIQCRSPYGNDKIDARDGEVDSVTCGVGEDTVEADLGDTVAADCETVHRTPGGDSVDVHAKDPRTNDPHSNDPSAPRASVTGVHVQRHGRMIVVSGHATGTSGRRARRAGSADGLERPGDGAARRLSRAPLCVCGACALSWSGGAKRTVRCARRALPEPTAAASRVEWWLCL